MTNEDKAEEIASNDDLYEDSENMSKIEECKIAALAAMKFKDEQPISELGGWHYVAPKEECTVLLNITGCFMAVVTWNARIGVFLDANNDAITNWLKWKRL